MKKMQIFLLIPIVTALNLFSPNYSQAQTANVSQIVRTVPEQTPAKGKIHFINKDNGETTNVDIDSTSGEASKILIPGNYIREIKDIGYGRFIDTNFVVVGDRRDTIELIKGFRVNPIASGGITTNGIWLMKGYTSTLPTLPSQIVKPWKLQDRPITIWANNDSIPNTYPFRTWLDSALTNLTTAPDSAVSFKETNIMPENATGVGIRFHWVNDTPTPGLLGETINKRRYTDLSPRIVDIYVRIKSPPGDQKTIMRELLRALQFGAFSQDPTSPLYSGGSGSGVLNQDDAEIVKRFYRMQNIPKYMGFYDTTIVNDVNAVKLENLGIPQAYILQPNYPNPFNPTTSISFAIPHREFVTLTIFNLIGQEVDRLVSEELSIGKYSTEWNASSIPSGVYFYRLQAGTFSETHKLILLK
jgi:hypothetical protein